ncbi:PadR family transcriptional regulator [Pseudonocardia endophytica]|uniref:Poly-beta-hydroxybutyrate-responsive repressor n=1 Tax=Pseudonocardia endophytica TaxID=401976 RepID=A0A4R1HJ23_PSEEN|nr:helix-turn-helix transcriptional regulator [Pseudonocardia endophytica]TCK22314.1 poly-beta-hydroxybutyrate-responsive repressor [Pseudonocardia endophytica]
MSELEPRNFLQPCLLLLLREQDDHGYGLVARLRPLHDGEGDAGGVYRALRGMERHGLVLSEWQASDVGPARRTYRITPEGRAALDAQAVELANVHMTLHVFMDRYERLPGHRPRGVMTHVDDRGAGRDGGVRATPRPRRGAGH